MDKKQDCREGKKTSIKDFTFLNTLGRGSFSEVFEVKNKKTEETYAIKVINKKKIF